MNQVRNRLTSLVRRVLPVIALAALVAAVGASWHITPALAKPTSAAPARRAVPPPQAEVDREDDERPAAKKAKKELSGKLNLNTATEEQLQLLPTVGPSKAERIVAWRKKNGAFKRAADLRKVKGFGYKTFKRLEPYLEVSGPNTLAEE
ncbi:MAG: helix-hairpin-helix domain-containing protein [Kofleriaceae bacterium]